VDGSDLGRQIPDLKEIWRYWLDTIDLKVEYCQKVGSIVPFFAWNYQWEYS
jgi:hypothetical protein